VWDILNWHGGVEEGEDGRDGVFEGCGGVQETEEGAGAAGGEITEFEA
jgi:hypothetical protein